MSLNPNTINQCSKRKVNTLEDEYHFLMVCPQYEEIRYKFFPERMMVHVSLNMFYNFVSTTYVSVITALAKYLYILLLKNVNRF